MIQQKIVNISIQEIQTDPKKRVQWVEHELFIKKLSDNKGLAEFKREFGTNGLKLWSDSYINDKFPELRKFVNKKKGNNGRLHKTKKLTEKIVLKRLFSRATKREKPIIDILTDGHHNDIIIDALNEIIAEKSE